MKVRAIKLGYYNHERRRPGDVFVLSSSKHFSKKWMQELKGSPSSKASKNLGDPVNTDLKSKDEEKSGSSTGDQKVI